MATNFNIALPFHVSASQHPERLALWADGRDFTYGEMLTLVRRTASWLGRSAHIGPRYVGILATRSWPACVGVLGAAWAGATYMPLNMSQPPEALVHLLRQHKLDALITDQAGARKLSPEVLQVAPEKILVPRDTHLEMPNERALQTFETLPEATPFEPVPVGSNDLAYVEFTSGSTGTPKGVMIPNGGVAHFLDFMRRRYQFTCEDRVAETADTSFDISVFDMFITWSLGASLHVVPKTQAIAPAKFIRDRKITVWFSVPSVATAMSRMGMLAPGAFPSLRVSLFSGEPLPVKAAIAWRDAAPNSVVDNLYGPTEATVVCLYERVGEEVNVTEGRDIVAIGRPFDGADAAVWDEGGNVVAAGITGELMICGPQLALGYLGDAEKTAARFVEKDGKRWYRTGDIAYQDESGLFHHLGRMDHQVKVLGHRVELEEIETHLRRVYRTDSVAAVAWPIEFGAATGIVGFVSSPRTAAPADANDELRKRMPHYMVPRAIHVLDSLPTNTSGKVDRKALARMLEQGNL
jgi:amino acid adenylation domain-containing protein